MEGLVVRPDSLLGVGQARIPPEDSVSRLNLGHLRDKQVAAVASGAGWCASCSLP